MLQHKKYATIFILLSVLLLLLFITDILMGSVRLSLADVFSGLIGQADSTKATIVQQIRIPKAITAILVGIALSISGLLMQTLFRNPLAGPYVLGISAGANLGVAIVMIGASFFGFLLDTDFSKTSSVFASCIGSAISLLLIVAVSAKVKSNVGLLLAGIMIGQVVSALQTLLEYFANANSLKGFVIWNMGSISNTNYFDMMIFSCVLIICLLILVFKTKKLDSLLLGDLYATSLGTNIKKERLVLICLTGALVGVSTAYCGPIAFIGIAVPHLCRILFKTAIHRFLLPACILIGPIILLLCDIICQLPSKGLQLPLNVVTSLIGAPVVLYLLFKNKTVY